MSFKNTKIGLVLLFLVSFQGCVEYRNDLACSGIEYMTFEELREGIEVLPAIEIKEAGKIYKYNTLLLVSEANKGVHVIDNSDRVSPEPKAFLKVPGNIDMAVKNGYLYVDSYMDLVVIDINNLDNIKEVNRTVDIFPYDPYQMINGLSYECGYDTTKGVLVGGAN